MISFLNWWGWDWVQVAACALGLVACLWFLLEVFRETGMDWRRNPFGRYLVNRKALMATLFVFILVNRWHQGIVTPPAWSGQDLVWAILLGWFAAQTFVPYRLLMSAQRAHDKEATR